MYQCNLMNGFRSEPTMVSLCHNNYSLIPRTSNLQFWLLTLTVYAKRSGESCAWSVIHVCRHYWSQQSSYVWDHFNILAQLWHNLLFQWKGGTIWSFTPCITATCSSVVMLPTWICFTGKTYLFSGTWFSIFSVAVDRNVNKPLHHSRIRDLSLRFWL